ncbi:MAG: alpha-ketoacid dehydrogenase subunit beta [Synergistetes bacterium]|nr:alpha-ketoacid dehydrogenase subunit beta [Synergistota bacterium]
MRTITFSEALREAIAEEMERNPLIFTFGEDIAKQGGIFGVYKGLGEKFPGRVLDTPISEAAINGAGVGAALAGARPIVEIHFVDFVTCGMDELVNQAAKIRYMFGGQAKLPVVFRMPDGVGKSAAAQHSQSLESWFVHIPGLKVVVPSTPYDAKGLMKTALHSDDPVMFMEHKLLYGIKGEVPEEEYFIPFGEADVKRQGKDVTVVATSRMVHESLKAAEKLAKQGIDVEVIDLRTLVPWDKKSVIKSVRKTGRLVVAHEAVKRAGWGAEIVATVVKEAFDYLDAPIGRVGAKAVPVPFSPPLEKFVIPDYKDVVEAVKELF